MNYDEPRQRMSDKRWDYTSMNDGRVHPIGYCAGWRFDHYLASAPEYLRDGLKQEMEKSAQFKDHFHTDGHATEDEAIACYGRYLLDLRTRTVRFTTAHPCLECNEWTPTAVIVGHGSQLDLCEKHQSREILEKHFVPPASSIHS